MSVPFDTCWKHARKVFKTVLRFFNLLEPDRPYMVLSLSKISVWLTLGLTVWVVHSGQGMTEIGGALIANVGAMANFAYRRSVQARTGTGGYGSFDNQMPVSDLDFDTTQEASIPSLDEPHTH